MKKRTLIGLLLCLAVCFAGCSNRKGVPPDNDNTSESNFETSVSGAENEMQTSENHSDPYTVNTQISDVISDPAFGSYGRLIFPANSGYYSGNTLGELGLTWYSHIDPYKTVEIVNTMHTKAAAGETIFYDIYTAAEKEADPAKRDTGLFFFKGDPSATQAEVLPMWEQCTTAFPTLWSCQRKVTMLLHLSIDLVRRLLVRIWQEQSLLSLNIQRNWKLTLTAIHCGAVRQAAG